MSIRTKVPFLPKERVVKNVIDKMARLDISGKKLDAADLHNISNKLCFILGVPDNSHEVLVASLIQYLGRKATHDIIEDLSKRVVYGLESILNNKILLPERDNAELVDVKCVGVYLNVDKKPAVELHLEIHSGHKAGHIEPIRCSYKAIQRISAMIGLRSRKWRKFHPLELMSLSFKALLVPDARGRSKLMDIDVSKEQKGRNSRIRLKRAAASKDCGKLCQYCPETTAQCDLAMHKDKWEVHICNAGHSAYRDRLGRCLFCLENTFKSKLGIMSFD